jgi:phage terminase Nu1 subunit (DNA packaging protein)
VAKILAFRAGEPLPGEDSPAGLTAERILLVRAQREKAELDLAERRGELQSRAETANDLVVLATAIRNRLLSVPDRVAGRLGLPRQAIEVISEEIRDALTELSKAEAA